MVKRATFDRAPGSDFVVSHSDPQLNEEAALALDQVAKTI